MSEMLKKLFNFLVVMMLLATSSTLLTGCQEAAPRDRAFFNPFAAADETNEEDTTEEEQEEPEQRPTGQIVFAGGHCVCQEGKQTIINDCSAFCADKTQAQEILYTDFLLGTKITEGDYNNLQGWCSLELDNGQANPSCQLEYNGSNGHTGYIDGVQFVDDDSITVNLAGILQEDVTYILTLVELSSGARTNSIQIKKKDLTEDPPFPGPLKMIGVNQYTCMSLGITTDTQNGDIFFQTAFPLHYYYINSNTPPTIPPGINNIYCHDIQAHGAIDDPLYDRLQLVPNHYTVWNSKDSRFYDLNNNTILDVHEYIQTEAQAAGVTFDASSQQIFVEFSWPNYPYNAVPTAPGGAQENSSLGYIMTPWIDQTTTLSYCPTQSHYYSNNKIFNILRDLIGVDTEGLYLAIKEPETTTDANGNVVLAAEDYLLIKESELKQIWFYIENGQKFEPTDLNVENVTTHFYWPPDPLSPYIKKNSQKLYTIKHPSQVNSTPSTGPQTSFIPHDNKFACVPKL